MFYTLPEDQVEELIADLLDKRNTLQELSDKWGVSTMSISRYRHDERVVGQTRKVMRQKVEKAINKGVLKADLQLDVESVIERAQHVYNSGDTGVKQDRKAMIEALRLELDALRTIGEVQGVIGKEPEAQVAAPSVTIQVQNMIGLPRGKYGESGAVRTQAIEGEVTEGGEGVLEGELVDDDPRLLIGDDEV